MIPCWLRLKPLWRDCYILSYNYAYAFCIFNWYIPSTTNRNLAMTWMMVCPAPARLAAPVLRAVQHSAAGCTLNGLTLPVGSQCVHHSVTAKEMNGLLNCDCILHMLEKPFLKCLQVNSHDSHDTLTMLTDCMQLHALCRLNIAKHAEAHLLLFSSKFQQNWSFIINIIIICYHASLSGTWNNVVRLCPRGDTDAPHYSMFTIVW